MIVDCERCPGQHLSPPACPSCVVRLLLDVAPPRAGGPPVPVDVVRQPESRPVEVELLRRTDDLGRELDTRERRAVAVLTAAGLLGDGDGRGAGHRGTGNGRRRFRTA